MGGGGDAVQCGTVQSQTDSPRSTYWVQVVTFFTRPSVDRQRSRVTFLETPTPLRSTRRGREAQGGRGDAVVKTTHDGMVGVMAGREGAPKPNHAPRHPPSVAVGSTVWGNAHTPTRGYTGRVAKSVVTVMAS